MMKRPDHNNNNNIIYRLLRHLFYTTTTIIIIYNMAFTFHPSVVVVVALTTSMTNSNHKNRLVASEILRGLRQSTSTTRPLDLTTDYYDPMTGLHSEGVWHNCLLGITDIQLSTTTTSSSSSFDNNHNNDDNDYPDAAQKIADSLLEYSWDGISFRRRAWSGNWDHTILNNDASQLYQADYFRESSEHRCVQHGIAVAFWSKLVVVVLKDMDDEDHDKKKKIMIQNKQRLDLIATQFVKEFWNPNQNKWTTVSNSQGGGTVLRPSASTKKITLGMNDDDDDDANKPYFRAVDQAIAILGCLEYLKVLKKNEKEENKDCNTISDLEHIITTTCGQLLSNNDGAEGFGFENIETARTYIGLNRNRNFWHDGWVLLALIQAHDYIEWPASSSGSSQDDDEQQQQQVDTVAQLNRLWKELLERYGHKDEKNSELLTDGTVWHWNPSDRDDADNVRYCGDNALCFAIRRKLRELSKDKEATIFNEKSQEDKEYLDDGFWAFIDTLRRNNDMNLSSVADVYPQVNLHPNSELAADLVWP